MIINIMFKLSQILLSLVHKCNRNFTITLHVLLYPVGPGGGSLPYFRKLRENKYRVHFKVVSYKL